MKTVSEGCAKELMRNGRGERDDGSAGLHSDLFQGKHLRGRRRSVLDSSIMVVFSYHLCFFSRNRNLF